jgi:hypothetical protein
MRLFTWNEFAVDFIATKRNKILLVRYVDLLSAILENKAGLKDWRCNEYIFLAYFFSRLLCSRNPGRWENRVAASELACPFVMF